MADTKASAFTATTAMTDDDTIPVIEDQDGTPLNRQITWANFRLAIPAVGCKVTNNGTQSIANNTTTAITFGAEDFDTNTFHDTGSNTSRLTVPSGYGGIYLLVGGGKWASTHASMEMVFRKNGTTIIPAASGNGGSGFDSVTTVVSLAATDYVELVVYQASGSAVNFGSTTATPDAQAHASLIRLGA